VSQKSAISEQFRETSAYFSNFWHVTLQRKLDGNDNSFAHLTLILLLHYFVKCWRRWPLSFKVLNQTGTDLAAHPNHSLTALKSQKIHASLLLVIVVRIPPDSWHGLVIDRPSFSDYPSH